MSKVLLLSPPGPENFMRNGRCDFVSLSGCQWWPLILGYASAYLRYRGHQTVLMDAQAMKLSKQYVYEHIRRNDYDLVVFMINSNTLHDDIFMANGIGLICRVALVGPAVSLHQRELDAHGFTYVMGEPEHGLDFILSSKASGAVRSFPLTLEELNLMPHVSSVFAELDHTKYAAPSEPYPFIDIMTSRGCAYGKCSFCLWPKTYSPVHTERGIGFVIDELKYIQSLKRFRSVMFQDDTMTEKRAIELSEAIMLNEHLFNLPWSCYARAELSTKALNLMRSAGCHNIHVGYESGNDNTLERVKKGITTKDMADFTRRAKRAGLRIHGDFMIGIDQTLAETRRTIDFACSVIKPHTAQFQAYIPFFGEKTHWRRQEIDKMVRKAYQKFYSNPINWKAAIEQAGKPRIFQESLKTVMKGGQDNG